jgi:hypothetical protein
MFAVVQPMAGAYRTGLPWTQTWLLLTRVPQPPQLSASVWVSTQAPVVPPPPVAQRWRPPVHAALQTPPSQFGVVPVQAWPMVPQFVGLEFRSTQLPPTAVRPGRHWQVPLPAQYWVWLQTAAPPPKVPQPPQLLGSSRVSVQRLLQTESFVVVEPMTGQEQALVLQVASVAQRLLQAPQLFGSVAVVAQVVPPPVGQEVAPVPQEQTPAVQTPPVPQLWPHAVAAVVPQLFGSVRKLTHWPLQRFGVAAGHTHMPLLHVEPVAHIVLQLPQWSGSVARLAQPAPPGEPPPQRTCVVSVQVQAPATQVEPVPQVRPQAPQFLLSVCVLTQVPPQSVGVAVGHAPQTPLVQVAPTAQV